MNRTSARTFAVGSAVAMLLAACGGGDGGGGGGGDDGEGDIVVGAVYSVTGSQASIDDPGLKGFELAAKQINEAGGVLDRQIDVAHVDAASDQTQLTSVVSELIDNDGAVVLGGINDSTFALAAGPIAQSAEVPFVVSGATLPTLPEQIGDHFFMVPFGDDAQAYAIADYATNELGAKTAYVLVDQAYDFTTALNTFFQERFTENGGEIVLEDSYQSGDTDFSAQISRVRALPEQPDVLFVSAIPNEAGITTQQIRDAGLTQPILSGDGFDTPLVSEVAGENADDVFFSTHVSLDSDAEEVTSFVEAYEAEYGNPPENAFAALGYDTMNLIAEAIEQAGEASPQAIRDALAETSDFAAVTGTITYEGESRKPTKTVTIIEVQDGKSSFVTEVTP